MAGGSGSGFSCSLSKDKRLCCGEKKVLEDTYYVVLLEVYGDIIIDMYVPIQERSDENDYR